MSRARAEVSARELLAHVDRLRREQPEVALHTLNAGFAAASRRATAGERGQLWRLRGHVLRGLRRTRAALVAYGRADVWFERARDVFERGRTVIGRIDALMYLGRYDEARRVAHLGRRWLERAGDGPALARLLNNEGNLLHRVDRPDLALPLYRRARRALARAGDRRAAAMVDGNVANCLILTGHATEARALYRAATRTHEQAGAAVDALNARYNLAYLDFVEHRHERALEVLGTIGEEAEARGAPSIAALAKLDRAEILLHLGSASDALREANAASAACAAIGLSYERAKAQTFAALAEHRLGRHAAARERLHGAVATFQAEGNAVWAGEGLLGLATVWRSEGHARGAGVILAAAVRRFAEAKDSEREACARALAARMHVAAGQFAAARRELRRLAPLARRRTSWRLRHLAWSARAELAWRTGQARVARRWLERAAHASERLAARILDEQWRASFWGEWGWPHGDLAALELEEGRLRQAFEALERGRGRGLLGRRRRTRREPELPHAVHAWAASRLVRDRERTRAGRALVAPAPHRLEPVLRDALETHVPVRVSLPELQRRLPPGMLVVDYMMHRGVLHAFAITRDGLSAVQSMAGQAQIDGLHHAITFALRDGAWGGVSEGGTARLDHLLAEMASLVLWPVLRVVGAAEFRQIAFMPVAPMGRLPWAALPIPDGRRLCEVGSPMIVPGLRLGIRREAGRPPAGPALVIAVAAEDLGRVEDEVAAICRTVPDAVALVGREATTAAFRRHAPAARWIHFAGHGAYHANQPDRSGLQLSDRWLEAGAIAELDLRAQWVTLSACQTARALVRPGEEWFGLSRSLMLAGVRSVVAAQWDVGDAATADLMTWMYRELASGAPLDRALARAQCAGLRGGRHPFDWAGFVLLNGLRPQGAEKVRSARPMNHLYS